jgi:phage terminase large subunit-like protein
VTATLAPRAKTTTRPPRGSSGPVPWWGSAGPAPHQQWPGVTIEIPSVWVPLDLKGLRCTEGADGPVWTRRADGARVPTWWVDDRGRWESLDGRYFFDRAKADDACNFFPDLLRHHIGEFAGQPFELMEYQRKLLTRPLFGWKRTSDGFRRFAKVFAFLPKGAGKSPWGSGTGLYCMLLDDEPAAEVYAVAGDKNQARVVHENAKIMVEESPDLAEELEVLKDSIYDASTRSMYQVLSSDAATKHGFRPHVVIFDEIHAQKNRDLYEALKKSMVKRRQPVMVIITHAGDDDEGIAFEEYDYGKKVLSGTVHDDTTLPVIFEASKDDDWTDPEVWRRVNPGHGITVKPYAIAAECEEAKAEPRKLNDFLRYHLNRWVNQATAWLPVDWWDACDVAMPSDAILAAAPVACGIDMAQKIDLASAVAVFRLPLEHAKESDPQVEVVDVDDEGKVIKRTLSLNYRIAVIPAFWLPEETLRERVKNDRVPYDIWRNEGILNVTDGAVIDSDALVKHVTSTLTGRFPLMKQAQIGYDPAFATEVSIRLSADGYTAVEVLQNYKHLSEACQVFEALVKARRVIHAGHRLLRWNLENVAVKRDDAGRIRMVKPKKAAKRIDGVVATVMALSRLMAAAPPAPPPPKPRISSLSW